MALFRPYDRRTHLRAIPASSWLDDVHGTRVAGWVALAGCGLLVLAWFLTIPTRPRSQPQADVAFLALFGLLFLFLGGLNVMATWAYRRTHQTCPHCLAGTALRGASACQACTREVA